MPFLKVDIEPDEGLSCIGFASQEKDYHVAWQMNRAFHINFEKQEDVRYSPLKGEKIVPFSKYISQNPDNQYTFRLLSNKNNYSRLIAEYGMLDYILIIDDEMGVFDVKEIIKSLRNIEGISFVQEIKLESLKNKDITTF